MFYDFTFQDHTEESQPAVVRVCVPVNPHEILYAGQTERGSTDCLFLSQRNSPQMIRHPQISMAQMGTPPSVKKTIRTNGNPQSSSCLNIPTSPKSRAMSDSGKPNLSSPTSSAKKYFKCLSSSSWQQRR